jgi:ribosome-binding protein aMBF1 (putative translation factor)
MDQATKDTLKTQYLAVIKKAREEVGTDAALALKAKEKSAALDQLEADFAAFLAS